MKQPLNQRMPYAYLTVHISEASTPQHEINYCMWVCLRETEHKESVHPRLRPKEHALCITLITQARGVVRDDIAYGPVSGSHSIFRSSAFRES